MTRQRMPPSERLAGNHGPMNTTPVHAVGMLGGQQQRALRSA